jgi:hypothetical protein
MVPAPVASAPADSAQPAAAAVRWSPAMLQSLRLQAFEQLVSQLARQIQASPGAPVPQWPADGVSEALGRLLQALLAQVGNSQGQALQLLAAQPGSAALLQALATGSTAPGVATPGAATPEAFSRSPAQGAPGSPAGAPVAMQAAAAGVSQPAAAAAALAVAAAKAAGVDALLAAMAPAAGAPAAGPPAAGSPASGLAGQALPALQNWWVQQGSLITPQGERGFTLSLQVPQAWAQAQGAALALAALATPAAAHATPAGGPAPGLLGAPLLGAPLRLPLDASLQALASGPVAVVIQPHGQEALRTSALLLLELQPLRQAGGPLAPPAALAALTPALAQEVQQLLGQRADPWLHMAAAQASGVLPRERRAFEHQSHFCTTEGCQYEGRAPCAQPFCSEMNRLWGVARMERSR